MRLNFQFIVAIIGLGAMPMAAALAQSSSPLYQAQAIVTGTGEANRQIGFRDCLGQELVKVSGDPKVLTAQGLAAMLERAGSFVSEFRYHDRLEGIPIHDEQGTHDRPQDLTCIYRLETIDGLLRSLGRKPWLGHRPRLGVFLAVRDARRSFVLANDGAESPYMAESFQAATIPLAMPIILPDQGRLASAGLDVVTLQHTDMQRLGILAKEIGADTALAGSIAWSDTDLGWVADWRVTHGGRTYSWQVRGVSFDEAFRNAIRGSAEVFSGSGDPAK
jgi:uncharacterized protein